jgi:hypothetical protein
MTARDLKQAWDIIHMCHADPSIDCPRTALAEQIALLLAELRKAKKAR